MSRAGNESTGPSFGAALCLSGQRADFDAWSRVGLSIPGAGVTDNFLEKRHPARDRRKHRGSASATVYRRSRKGAGAKSSTAKKAGPAAVSLANEEVRFRRRVAWPVGG
jgi:hypothetical protein